jgi:succinate dehydrogenase / fumarate reductase flavoprotein subunit
LTEPYSVHSHGVLVIGAGGAGLRAAIEASAMGADVAVVCKSLLGKAHTVMAEGGIAAALGNLDPQDNWSVHFQDTMRGGQLINNWRMAELHAREAPERVYELEAWGAVFDRTPNGKISQRPFGAHTYVAVQVNVQVNVQARGARCCDFEIDRRPCGTRCCPPAPSALG